MDTKLELPCMYKLVEAEEKKNIKWKKEIKKKSK